ncbi:peptidase inhibitor family I36 protein [Streptomyces sp. NPDC051784]|uniref:peptidase inhibitor family I36 protein n=1 Tax=Streptomyces sp. NPDC051784 TaxID=3155805 RepID=UPI0034353825
MRFSRARIAAALSVPLTAATLLAAAPSAHAAAGASCNVSAGTGCLRLYYNTNQQGSSTYFYGSNVSNFASYTFLTSGAGKGLTVKNNAAAASNDANTSTTIYYNSNYGGACDTLTFYAIASQLHNTYNNNASFKFNTSGSGCYKF